MLDFLKRLLPSWFQGKIVGNSSQPASMELIFERFRKVLKCNNAALEIMADMGEKLGGNYIFDRHYVVSSVEALSDAVLRSIHALNLLCDNRYQNLYPVYDRLTENLKAILEGREDQEGPLLLDLERVPRRYLAIIGGKNANLVKIISDLHLKVPEGFIIATPAYHEFIRYNELQGTLDIFEASLANPDSDDSRLEELRLEIEDAIQKAQCPPLIETEIERFLDVMERRFPTPFFLAVRSSAQEEDRDFSFAGQFTTILNVPPKPKEVFEAYRKVVASLFGKKAVRYRRTTFPGQGQMSIAAGCQRMIDSMASGVVYSVDPTVPTGDTIVVVSTWGQGEAVVEGDFATDRFVVRKGPNPVIIERHVARKTSALFLCHEGGLEKRPILGDKQRQPSLDDADILKLATYATKLENYFKRPQDIEWAKDSSGTLYILQSRPLVLRTETTQPRALPEALSHYDIIVADKGEVAQQGIGAGPVKIVHGLKELDDFPDGAVLVSRRDSSHYVRIMHRTAAIVTEVGTPVSHMSTLCREMGVPCLVNVEGILNLVEDGMEITVDAEDRRIYKGRVPELLAYHASTSMNLFGTPEFRLLKRVLNAVAPLNLVDPLIKEFAPEYCQTYHDILRFVHESAVQTMVNLGKDERNLLKEHTGRHLDLPIPAGILVIDIGGGLAKDAPPDNVQFKDVTSVPFKAILEGMLFPGVWNRTGMHVRAKDLMTSMLNVPTDTLQGQYSGHNIAIISREYMNLSFRLGYHFNIIDAFCSEYDRDNHIYFRFLGGATDISKRSRRAKLIANILEAFDFNVKIKGDIVTARSGNVPQQEMIKTLDILGRLIGFTRQLDVQMESDAIVSRYVDAFLNGDYEIVCT